ncbi:MAG: hypothetical protein ACPLSY_03365 [Moorellaceae bacterium]
MRRAAGIRRAYEMGLDVYAVRPFTCENGEYPLAPEEAFRGVPRLAGGWAADGGCGPYFRGTPYAAYILDITGVSLYQDFIPPEVVGEMAAKLEKAAAEGRTTYQDVEGEVQEVSLEEIRALAAWFRVCAENGYAVAGSW